MILHFNFQNYLWLEQFGNMPAFPYPIFIAFTPLQAQRLGGLAAIASYFRSWKQRFPLHRRVYLHLDHAKHLSLCYQALATGFDSIMFDGAHLSFSENVALTKKIVADAHQHGVKVEAELGCLDLVNYQKTNINQVQYFTEATQVDYLAIAVGNYHGLQSVIPELDWNLLRQIRAISRAQIVLHGASGIDWTVLQTLKAQKLVDKLNFDTDLQRHFLTNWKRLKHHSYYEHQAQAFQAVQRWMTNLVTLFKEH